MLATVKCSLLKSCLSDLTPLFSKGSSIVPVGFSVNKSVLTIVCNNKCSYLNSIELDEEVIGVQEVVVQYKNILDYLPNTGTIDIEIQSNGIYLSNESVSLTLPAGYSEYKTIETKGLNFKPIVSTGYLSGLKALLNCNLVSLTKMEKPITVYQQLSVVKYPQLLVQARTMGLPFSGVFTPELINLIVKFQPTEVCDDSPTFVLFKRKDAYLQVSREPVTSANNFMDYMKDLSDPIQFDMQGYAEKVRCMTKLGNNCECTVVLHSNGLSSSITQEGVTVSNKLGDCNSEVKKVFKLPIGIWNLCIRALEDSTAQILYGGDKVCLRTQSIIIIARVML